MCLITGSFHLVYLSSILRGLLLRIVPLAGCGSGPFIIPLAGFEWPQPGFLSSLDLVRSFNSPFPPSLKSPGLCTTVESLQRSLHHNSAASCELVKSEESGQRLEEAENCIRRC